MNKITHGLWFDKNGEEAARFYTSLFKDGKIGRIAHFPREDSEELQGQPPGSVMSVEFSFAGQDYLAINGGDFEGGKHNFSHSIIVNCETQEEIDWYWEALIKNGGKEVQCGWLTDRYGISWQIVPTQLASMLTDKDRDKSDRVMQAVWKMIKLNLKDLQRAYDGK